MTDLLRKPTLIAAMATPLDAALRPDADLLLQRCRALIAEGCDGVALFGTTGEGPHLTVEHRQQALQALVEGGLPPSRLVVSASALALPDAVALGRHAAGLGVGPILLMPPFFLRGATRPGGVERFIDLFIERCAAPRLALLLYHFPEITGFGFAPELIGRLVERYGPAIAGVKDSGGDWDHTLRLIQGFPGLAILTGTEVHLPQALAAGAAGTICGLGNVMPALLRRLIDRPDAAHRLVPQIQAIDDLISAHPFIPAVKAVAATLTGRRDWRRVTPPLEPLDEAATAALGAAVQARLAAAMAEA
ncbi:MAG: dihydrodipicolinate synthase family protein [Dongiaceae bacterium]